VFKALEGVKYNPDGSVDKYNARMVLRGDWQVAGKDYDINKIFGLQQVRFCCTFVFFNCFSYAVEVLFKVFFLWFF
jgi:hypothetical protein